MRGAFYDPNKEHADTLIGLNKKLNDQSPRRLLGAGQHSMSEIAIDRQGRVGKSQRRSVI